MHKLCTLLLLLAFVSEALCLDQNQSPTIYGQKNFEVEIQKDIIFGSALVHSDWNSKAYKERELTLDLYRPVGLESPLPVVIIFYGGGFVEGNKEREEVVESANFFASRGFLVLAPTYRLASDYGTLPDELYQAMLKWPEFLSKDRDAYFAMYPAARDAKAAARWLFANADKLGANTNYVTVMGNSAGALLSIVLGVTDDEHFRDEISAQQDFTLLRTYLNQKIKVHTIINHWGGPFAIDMQRIFYGYYPYDSADAPMQIVHGTMDTTVPFVEALRLAFNYQVNGIDYELHPLHWVGHQATGELINGKQQNQLALEFILKTQGLLANPD